MDHPTIAVDLSKSVFEIAVSERPGHVRERHRLSRSRFVPFFAERQPATVLLEACGSAHHWGRQLQTLGHSVVLLPPHAVRPYVPRNKTDRADTKGLLEAFRNDAIRPVPVKSVAQQTLAALHRLRSAWLASRTARINTLRGLLREFGVAIPLGARHVLPHVQSLLEDADSVLPHALRPALAEGCAEIRELEDRTHAVERQLATLARQTPVVARLLTIPGIGLLTATARLPPHAPHPRRPRRARPGRLRPLPRPTPGLGARRPTPPWSQHSHRRPRQQARPARLGGLEERHKLSGGPYGINPTRRTRRHVSPPAASRTTT